jgi:hypothetical protein
LHDRRHLLIDHHRALIGGDLKLMLGRIIRFQVMDHGHDRPRRRRLLGGHAADDQPPDVDHHQPKSMLFEIYAHLAADDAGCHHNEVGRDVVQWSVEEVGRRSREPLKRFRQEVEATRVHGDGALA